MKRIFLCVCAWAFFFQVASADTDTFTISQTIGIDTATPTVPANFTATPVTTSQIDLDWDPSSDNVAVGGYQVFRDASQIATTTLTAYSDTGLTASTTYSYYIIAFDTSFNYATPTATIATTTLPLTPTSTATTTDNGNRGGPTKDIVISNLVADADLQSIALSFSTNIYTQATIRWGRTADYEGGFIAFNKFARDHQTLIDGLDPGTTYEIEITLVDRSGDRTITENITVVTDAGVDTEAPPNVTNFSALLQDSGVDLSWENPTVDDFSHVRVMSSDAFFPTHPYDGWFVYEGSGEDFFDARVLPEGSSRFYTIFVFDRSGNVSSGVVTLVQRGEVPVIDFNVDASSTIAVPPSFVFDDIVFVQNGKRSSSFEGFITLAGGEDTLISLPYELLPQNLKTIVMTLSHPEDETKTFSFLLRINADRSAYEAHIGPLVQGGVYPTVLTVFDFKTKATHRVSGTVTVRESTTILFSQQGPFSGIQILALARVVSLFFLILLILYILRIHRRNKENF